MNIDKKIEEYLEKDAFIKMLLETNSMSMATMQLLMNKNIINEKELKEMQEIMKNNIIEHIKTKFKEEK